MLSTVLSILYIISLPCGQAWRIWCIYMYALSLWFMLAVVGDLTQVNSLDPGHTRETSDRSGPKSFDSGQNWDDPAWDHSSLLFTRFVWWPCSVWLESLLFTDAPKQMKSFQECRNTQRAGGTGSSHLFNVRSKRHSFWRDAKGAEPGPMSA